ncbi:MAG: hypothetical protein JWQ81_3721 [Amycolatopsis sp.]|nr:hypothetical protein [Amycolatopsis sp.]
MFRDAPIPTHVFRRTLAKGGLAVAICGESGRSESKPATFITRPIVLSSLVGMLRRRSALAVLLVVGLLGGCSSSQLDTSGPLPDGHGLVTESANALTGLRSVRFTFSSSGVIPGLPIRQVEGDATLDGGPGGAAKGQADMQESINRFQLTYVLTGNKLYLTPKSGPVETVPAPAGFTPASLLEPDGALHKLLTSATGMQTEASELLGSVQTYRVAAKVSKAVISSIIPGIQSDVDVKFWVAENAPKELMRMWVQIPPVESNEGATMLELALSNHNVPVTVTPPAG